MQPDLPEPVVPAMRICGIRARSAWTDAPEMSLPSHTDSGLAPPGMSAKMSPSVTTFGREVGHLDPHGLLAGNRREDAELRRRERIGEVVLQGGDLAHLRAGRELKLVTRHARADDLADEMRLDAEVGERLEERLGGALDRLLWIALLGVGPRALEDACVRKLVAGVLGRRHVEHGLGLAGKLGLEVVELIDEHG